MVIKTNVSSIYSDRVLRRNNENVQKDIEKLSSGSRINRAADDAAGLAVSEKMRSQVEGLNQASRNAADGISLIQTAEGYLNESENILQRMRVLSVQAANGIYDDTDRGQIQTEVTQLIDEVTRISGQAQFNKMKILNGSYAGGDAQAAAGGVEGAGALIFHVGANTDERLNASIGDMSATALGIDAVSVATADGANQAITTIDEAINRVSTERANLGAYQNRLESIVRSNEIGSENLSASRSRINDANMASESVNFVRDNILTQSTVSMLAQANMKNQGVLQLLG